MSWLRVGDTAPVDARVLSLEDPQDPLWRPACFGAFIALAALSAQHDSDYAVGADWVRIVAGARGEAVMKALVAAGLASVAGGRGARRTWRLVDDAPELIHVRPRAERTWELTRKRDTHNPRLLAPVLLRDGDACRWCSRTVNPHDHKTSRQRTLDHLRPGVPAETADDLVVACLECNGARGRDWQDEDRRATFDERWRLPAAPSPLIFQRSTVTWLTSRGHQVPDDAVVVEPRAATREHRGTDRAAARSTALATRRAHAPVATPSDPGSEVPSPATAGATAPTGRKTSTEEPSLAVQAGATAPRRSTTSSKEPHPATQAGAAASTTSTTSTTAPPAPPDRRADEHPGTPHPTTPEAPAQPEHPDPHPHPVRTHGCGGDGPGRDGSGRVPDPPPLDAPPSTQPPDPPAAPEQPTPPPRRRGRRRPRLPGAPT